MFRVCCPASVLWHPAVHHSLLLLRALRQRHTLVLDAAYDRSDMPTSRLPLRLLSDAGMHIRIAYDTTSSAPAADTAAATDAATTATSESRAALLPDGRAHCTVYAPEHILHLCTPPACCVTATGTHSQCVCALDEARAAYLETSAICTHILHAADALLVALASDHAEVVRLAHAWLMDLLARLDHSLPLHGAADDATAAVAAVSSSSSSDGSDTAAAAAAVVDEHALSTWPLFATLQFLVDEGGLLTSAFPRVRRAYTALTRQSNAVRLHRRLVQQTMQQQQQQQDQHAQAQHRHHPHTPDAATATTASCGAHPQRRFLHDAQRRLHAYTSSVSERGAVGDVSDADGGVTSTRQARPQQVAPSRQGAPGGRLGLQSVPARLPWPLQNTPLRRA